MDRKSRNNGVVAGLVVTCVALGAYALLNTHFAQDTIRGWQYQEPVEIGALREELGLTDAAERIFLATAPALEGAESFNEHCKNQREDVSLLGCYTDGKMYIYDVQSEELADVKKVTAAHELLHATWVRMNRREREEVTQLLEQYEEMNAEWVKSELEYYNDDEKMEELYTRVATKVRELPEGLEGHYQKYFRERQKIVEFYENYQAPFEELRRKCLELKEQTEVLGREITAERESYEESFNKLQKKVNDFNQCAETVGCFSSEEEFFSKRRMLEDETMALHRAREELNQKIDKYNEMVIEYEGYRLELGELSDSMNSKINKVKEGEI